MQRAVDARLTRLALGNFGDHKALGARVYELRIMKGPGLRVYYGLKGNVSSSGRLERQRKAIRLPSVVIRFLQDDVSHFPTIIASKAFCLPSAPFAPSGINSVRV